jgi:hypothetical protein
MSSAYDPGRIPRDDAEAALAARHELGGDYEPAVVDSFVDRLDKVIDARIAEHVERSGGRPPAPRDQSSFWLPIVSLGCGIPLTGAAGGIAGVPGIVVVWIGIVLVNMAHAMSSRRQQPPQLRR